MYEEGTGFLSGLLQSNPTTGGPGSSVGIATDYGLDGLDRIPVGTKFSACPDRPWGPPSPL